MLVHVARPFDANVSERHPRTASYAAHDPQVSIFTLHHKPKMIQARPAQHIPVPILCPGTLSTQKLHSADAIETRLILAAKLLSLAMWPARP